VTPEVEAELRKIGWTWASRDPRRKFLYEMVLQANAGMVAHSPQDAKEQLAQHRILCATVFAAIEGLRTIPKDAATSINLGSTPVDDRDGGWPDHIASAASALETLVHGLIDWTEFLEHEAQKARRGGRHNEPAYRIAAALAEIYVIGLGEKPAIGNLADGRGPSGPYGKVTKSVLAHLGFGDKDVVRPCRAAIRDLTEDRMRMLLRLHQPYGAAAIFRVARIPRK
jgi:hypothetical protein